MMTQKGNNGQVGNSTTRATGFNLCVEKTEGFQEMGDDRTGSVRDVFSRLLRQLIAVDGRILCGYRLIID